MTASQPPNIPRMCGAGLERLELTSDGVMTRDLSPLSLLQKLQLLQITSFNDPVRYPIPPAVLTVTSLRELSMRALGLNLIQVTPHHVCPPDAQVVVCTGTGQ